MMKYRIAVAALTLALSGANAVNAQVQPPQDRINTALSRARQVGIPVALLESKMAEGKAKGISLERIAAAIERREGALERASQALRGNPSDAASLSVGADAIESGVNETVLKALADDAPRDRRTVAIATLTQLVQQGDLPAAALAKVRNALKRGPDALPIFRPKVITATVVAAALRMGKDAAIPAEAAEQSRVRPPPCPRQGSHRRQANRINRAMAIRAGATIPEGRTHQAAAVNESQIASSQDKALARSEFPLTSHPVFARMRSTAGSNPGV